MDVDNFEQLARLLSRYKFSLVFSKNEYLNQLYPALYQDIIRKYFHAKNELVTLDEVAGIQVENTLFSELTNSGFYTIANRFQLTIEADNNPHFKTLVITRKKLEDYFAIPNFSAENRPYIVTRICELMEDRDLIDFHYNRGKNYFGGEWAPHMPTDAHIVMWLFSRLVSRGFTTADGHQSKEFFFDFAMSLR